MDLYYRARHYVGSTGQEVEVRPAKELRAMAGRKWLYRFPHDKRWRESADKFRALLEAAWELGKTGAEMAFTPVYRRTPGPRGEQKKREPRYNLITLAIQRAEAKKMAP